MEITRIELASQLIKPLIFDGQALWSKYRRQFEAAAKMNGCNEEKS